MSETITSTNNAAKHQLLTQFKAESSPRQAVYQYGAKRAQTTTPKWVADDASASRKENIYE